MSDHDEAIINTVETGTTIGELVTVLSRFLDDTRIGLFPRMGGGVTLAILDEDGDMIMRVWSDL